VSDLEFKPWRSIEKYDGVHVTITEKIHGTNAHVHVVKDEAGNLRAHAAKRTSYARVGEHFGFGSYVAANEAEICGKLGEGRHYGEWVGPGVNSDYGLKEKVFVLFNHAYHQPRKDAGQLPPQMDVVPVLYDGPYEPGLVERVKANLRASGSKFAPGFARPEGVVITFPQFGTTLKSVFAAEETGWTSRPRPPMDPNAVKPDTEAAAAPYLQPVRLEKLLMRDESYLANFPKSLPAIVRAYLVDLFADTQGLNEGTIAAVKKHAFKFVLAEAGATRAKMDITIPK